MKKFLLIIALCSILSACANQAPVPRRDGVLLSFNDLAREITVDVETAGTADADRLPEHMPLGTP